VKWIRRTAFCLLVLSTVAMASVYLTSEWALNRDRGVPLSPLVADTTPRGIAEGERLARINSCLNCHGEGHGRILFNKPMIAVITAPPFAPIAALASDAELARSIRQGLTRSGWQMWVMPSHGHLADGDTARIIGFLRTLRPIPRDISVRRSFGPIGRLAILTERNPVSFHPALSEGRERPADIRSYFVQLTCLSCHDLVKSRPAASHQTAPPLAAAARVYDQPTFERLLRTGAGIRSADLGLMSDVARTALRYFSNAEIAAIKVYLDQVDANPRNQ
jgi:cytochrome c553